MRKVVILGPESTGKSTLSRQLSEHYKTLSCPEYAREYLTKHGMNYTYDDLLTIAKGQLEGEDKYTKKLSGEKNQLLFVDTDMYVMKVWCEFVFGKCHPFILKQIVERKYDLYLLCKNDLPWVEDSLREYPDAARREVLFKMYQDILVNQSTPWAVITGSNDERLKKAIKAVDAIL